jgi:hypothetical protein
MQLDELLNKAGKFYVIGLDVTARFTCFYCGWQAEYDNATFPSDWVVVRDGDAKANVISCDVCTEKRPHNFLDL